ncbi:MAG: hypothetical protein WC340_01805, partial [Kiritimatiellia bacterium]
TRPFCHSFVPVTWGRSRGRYRYRYRKAYEVDPDTDPDPDSDAADRQVTPSFFRGAPRGGLACNLITWS